MRNYLNLIAESLSLSAGCVSFRLKERIGVGRGDDVDNLGAATL